MPCGSQPFDPAKELMDRIHDKLKRQVTSKGDVEREAFGAFDILCISIRFYFYPLEWWWWGMFGRLK